MIVDWGAGPGGWDVGAAALGLRPVGLEWGEAECATRAAAGHLTIRCDASAYPAAHLRGRLEGAILSTPCPDFSAAGKRAGLGGETGPLVYEVLRWARAARPRWIAAENVKEVAPIFRSFRRPLADLGYSVWTGVLDVADYGVPQNRKRAFLLASLDRRAVPPAPTHSRTGHAGFHGPMSRWVAMEDAVGWGWPGRPSRAVCGARPPRWLYRDGDGTHETVLDRRQQTRGVPAPLVRVDRPAPPVTGGAGKSQWVLHDAGGERIVEPWELGVLQGFPADYPWQGNKTEQARQIGNAVPPPMAAHLLAAVTGRALRAEEAA